MTFLAIADEYIAYLDRSALTDLGHHSRQTFYLGTLQSNFHHQDFQNLE